MTLIVQTQSRPASLEGRTILEVAGCTVLVLLFALQQVVIGHGLGEGLSLGSAAMRIFAVAVSIAFLWRYGIPRAVRVPLIAILACLCVLALSTLLSEHRSIAVKFAVRYATELAMLWCILNLVVTQPRLHATLVRATVVVLWIGILVAVGSRSSIGPARDIALLFHSAEVLRYLPRVSGLYEHPNIFGAVAVLVAVLTMQFHERGEIGRLTVAGACVGLVAVLVLTEARNPLVPLLLLAVGFAVIRRGRPRRIALALLALLALLAAALIWQRYEEITSASQETLLTMFSLGRTYIWAGAIDAWREHPWFGLGPGVFQFLTPDYTGGRFLRGELHAHNLLLGILSETGLAGLLAFAGLVAAFVAPALRSRDPALLRWAVIWLVTLLGLGLFDFYLPFYGFSLHLALAACLFLVISQPSPRECRDKEEPALP